MNQYAELKQLCTMLKTKLTLILCRILITHGRVGEARQLLIKPHFLAKRGANEDFKNLELLKYM